MDSKRARQVVSVAAVVATAVDGGCRRAEPTSRYDVTERRSAHCGSEL